MSWWTDLRERANALVRGSAADQELHEEMRQHIELETRAQMQRGLSERDARRHAEQVFGGLDRHYEQARDARGIRPLGDLLLDVRYALRTLRRNPGFTIAAVLVLALGIGANTSIFSAVNAIVLRPLPFPQSEQLYMVWEENPEKGWYKQIAAPANMLDWKERVRAFEDVAGYSFCCSTGVLSGRGEPRVLKGQVVTGNFFSVLGARPLHGRVFTDSETWQSEERAIVLSHRVWQDAFSADPAIVNQVIQLNGRPRRVVGVMPPSFAFPAREVDYWQPTGWNPGNRQQVFFRRAHSISVIARLRDGVSSSEANAQLQVVVKQLQTEYPETNRVMGAGITQLHEFLLGNTRTPLLVLLGAAGLLLLIGCANVGNLLLVKATGRQREIAVRAALGAGRFRLIRQLMTESLVLSIIGGTAGLFLGIAGTRLLVQLQPPGMLPDANVGVDARVVGFVMATTMVCGMLFGSMAAGWMGRATSSAALKEGGRTGAVGRSANRLASGLVVAEVALALLLVTGAGLLVRSFQQLTRVNPGFDSNGVLAVSLVLTDAKYDSQDKARLFFNQLIERTRAVAGLTEVGATNALPLVNSGYTSDFVFGHRPLEQYGTEVVHRSITPEYLRTMRVPILKGRGFTEEDRFDAAPVVLINEALAKQQFANEDPIGKRIAFDRQPDSTTTWYTIVGVVGNEHQRGIGTPPQIEVLNPFEQEVSFGMTLVLRTDGDPLSLLPALRQTIAAQDPSLPIFAARSMDTVRADALMRERFLMLMLLTFAAVAMVLSIVGVYGVIAQFTRQRTQEIGVRLALGAQPHDVQRMVVLRGGLLVLGGIAIGLLAAVASTGAMTTMLYNVQPVDMLTFGTVTLVLLTAGVLATWLPARRASRLDPGIALRPE